MGPGVEVGIARVVKLGVPGGPGFGLMSADKRRRRNCNHGVELFRRETCGRDK